MREILFRGKDIDTGKWAHGGYSLYPHTRFPARPTIYEVDHGYWRPVEIMPETLGQYTGLEDRNDKRIFEGDIVRCKHFYKDYDGTFESAKIRSAYGKAFDKTTDEPTYLRNYAVRMYDGSWELRNGSDGHKINSNYIINHEIEVIGNIHDNPELLKGKP